MKSKLLMPGTKAARAAIAGIALLAVVSTAQANPVDVTATVFGSTGDWTYDLTFTNNLGGTNYIYAVGVAGPTYTITGSPSGWVGGPAPMTGHPGQFIAPQEWCYIGDCYYGQFVALPTNLAPGDTLGGFLFHDTTTTPVTSLGWSAFAEGGDLGNPGFQGTVSVSSVPVPAVGAGLPGLLFAGGGFLAWWRRRQKIA
jgi:hypothetical protein